MFIEHDFHDDILPAGPGGSLTDAMNKIRIAARVAAYMYSDGIPYDGPEMHKSIAEIYAQHSQGRHKIDLSKIARVGEPDPQNPDSKRR